MPQGQDYAAEDDAEEEPEQMVDEDYAEPEEEQPEQEVEEEKADYQESEDEMAPEEVSVCISTILGHANQKIQF